MVLSLGDSSKTHRSVAKPPPAQPFRVVGDVDPAQKFVRIPPPDLKFHEEFKSTVRSLSQLVVWLESGQKSLCLHRSWWFRPPYPIAGLI
ncbi:hypothetical protein JCGZ_09977 [Jatropha curcas]|uniref:Uncharacterized protein n=1 Tax=Jatropha curcas TaxID=180498 RepID=A0A067KWP3_JATCU|nr:hypothetical protein JCGZ_09977 [Jatropha curcas]